MKNNLTIIYNPFLNSTKKNSQLELIKEASKVLKIKLNLISSNTISCLIKNKKLFFSSKKILFLEKNIAIGQYLEKQGYWLYNNSTSINITDNKALTHLALIKSQIKQPKTLIGPLTFGTNISESIYSEFEKNIKESFIFPLIIKEVYGSFGQQIYLIKNLKELKNKFYELKNKQIIVQEFYSKYSGTSLRAVVINQKIIGLLEQTNKKDFRSNLSQNSEGKILTRISSKNEKLIKFITKKLNLFYGGIDFLYDDNKNLIFCEANSNCQLMNISKIYNQNFAIKLLEEIMKDKKYYEKK